MNLLNEHIDNWFEAFAEYEALISFGIFAYKNPQYNYPVCREDISSLQCKDIIHPLLDSEKQLVMTLLLEILSISVSLQGLI